MILRQLLIRRNVITHMAIALVGILMLSACDRSEPDRQYFFLNAHHAQYNEPVIWETFGPQDTCRLSIGNAILIYLFEHPITDYKPVLEKHFSLAEEHRIPVLVEMDPISFMNDAPELWNWFDPSLPGYNPDNRENVEWYDWGSEHAVRIGWLNWGRQIRLRPMINLFSPDYQSAVRERVDSIMTWTSVWYKSLPKKDRWLLCGVKITGELAFGINNWYYPDGNSYADKNPSEDPTTSIQLDVLPDRTAAQIGYAALTYMGRKNSGEVTAEDIYAIEKEYARFIADLVQGYGIPRERLFSHAGGRHGDLDAAIQPGTCPSWTFYWEEAMDPGVMPQITDYLPLSDAPYWGCAEWNIGDQPRSGWEEALENTFSIPRCRFATLFNFDFIYRPDSTGRIRPNPDAVAALKARM